MTDNERKELLLKAKPILFNTEMVRAILDGRKTVTRRVIKPQPICRVENITIPMRDGDSLLYAAPYTTDDILYVRETWKQATADYAGGGYGLKDLYLYKADQDADTSEMLVEAKWHPSINMPKEAARIFLRVTNVSVERLQDITEEQAIAEDTKDPYDYQSAEWYNRFPYLLDKYQIAAFAGLWNSTIKKSSLNFKLCKC